MWGYPAADAYTGYHIRLSGFCCSLLHLIFCLICFVSWCWSGGSGHRYGLFTRRVGCPVPGAGIYFCISEVAPDEERVGFIKQLVGFMQRAWGKLGGCFLFDFMGDKCLLNVRLICRQI